MNRTQDIIIPLLRKNHACSQCIYYEPKKPRKKSWCSRLNKSINNVALECEPLPEWEKEDVENDQ